MTDRAKGTKLDVCHWIGRAAFDIIGLSGCASLSPTFYETNRGSGFGYAFQAIQDESNEVYLAYRDMFEIAISQNRNWKTVAGIYFPLIHSLLVSLELSLCIQLLHEMERLTIIIA